MHRFSPSQEEKVSKKNPVDFRYGNPGQEELRRGKFRLQPLICQKFPGLSVTLVLPAASHRFFGDFREHPCNDSGKDEETDGDKDN